MGSRTHFDRDSKQADRFAPQSLASSAEHLARLEIGHARARDLPAVARMQRRAFPPRLAYTLSTLVLLWVLPWVRLLVARRDGKIVGCVIGDRVLEGSRIINLAVEPAARGQGIGAALLYAAEDALPVGDMTLMVQSGNTAARALYRRVGYEDESENPNYYGPGRPGVWMRKRRGALR
ncbi:MAG TPA: GNAT family N-acetyltransferase [Thermomicrobiales bacterium]|nr:GNAT family N-acetyltransferase [Thermomicrobiales bacterium]